MSELDPYRELGLAPEAAEEPEVVKAAFKALARKYHPDRFTDALEKAEAERKMARLNEAQRLILSGAYRPVPPPPAATADPTPPVVPPPTRETPARPRQPRHRPTSPLTKALWCALALGGLLIFSLPGRWADQALQEARTLTQQGQYSRALAEVNRAIDENPRSGPAYLLRARLWHQLGEPDKALIDLANARALVSPAEYQAARAELEPPQAPPTPQPQDSPSP